MSGITFTALGASNEVGRSSFLIDAGDKILLDRGVKLMSDSTEYPLPVRTNLDAAIISHAHLDHCGDLPHLFLKSNCLCYMTAPTLEIAELLWHDTLKIAGIEGMDAHFSKDEIERTKKYSFPMNFRKRIEITKHASLELLDAGHILGSAMSKLELKNKTMLYTGDYKPVETRLLTGADSENVGKIDYLVIESTYGDREHPSREKVEKAFVEKVREVLDRKGVALVPAFAVGRSQELVEILAEHKIDVPIYLDGMGQKAATIHERHPQFLKDPRKLKKALGNARWIRDQNARKRAVKEPCVIVTTAGMLQGGPALNYLKNIYSDPRNAVLLTGFQVKDTPGSRLLSEGRINIDGKEYVVKCEAEKFDFSAHPSQSDMLKSLNMWGPEKVLLVHGDSEVMLVFKKTIESELGIDTIIPEKGQMIKLSD